MVVINMYYIKNLRPSVWMWRFYKNWCRWEERFQITCTDFDLVSINENHHTWGRHLPSIFYFYIYIATHNHFLLKKRPKSFAVAWNRRNVVSKSEDYIMHGGIISLDNLLFKWLREHPSAINETCKPTGITVGSQPMPDVIDSFLFVPTTNP